MGQDLILRDYKLVGRNVKEVLVYSVCLENDLSKDILGWNTKPISSLYLCMNPTFFSLIKKEDKRLWGIL